MRKIFLVLFVCIWVLSQNSYAALSKHIVDYRIEARLNVVEHKVFGHQILTWLNDSEVEVNELQFHLYLNAFRNNRSTFMKESGGSHRGFEMSKEDWGYIEIIKIQIENGADLTDAVKYIQLDDGNKDDLTVISVMLPEPVLPKEKISLEIEFTAKLPKVFSRSGYAGNFYMVAQWFPKIGVWQNGEWNCHQYHSTSEFFADFGVYEVEITVPAEYVVGATGKQILSVDNPDSTKTYTYYQEDVHDFAWTACPDFVEFREPYFLQNPTVETEIILLVHRSHLNQKSRYLDSLKQGIEFFSRNYGPYPYPTITLVDPPINGLGAGGMEYPTLFTSMAVSFIPKGVLMPELVTIHEFGHGYWYGIVGSNEFEEAWLDEGVNTYSELKAMQKYYGKDTSFMNFGPIKIGNLTYSRAQIIGSSRLDPIVKNSWEYYSSGSYGMNSYARAGVTLLTLENYLGEEVMAEIMKTYYERWKFRHPTTNDFTAVAEEVSGLDLDWFFDQFLHSPDRLDYAIGTIKSYEVLEPGGIFNGELRIPEEKKGKNQDQVYKNEVTVVRKGELVFPQEILIVFDDGEEIKEKWDGRERWKRFVYFKTSKLKSAQVDPENKILLDINFLNNSRIMNPDKTSIWKYALSCMAGFQQILTLLPF